MSEANFLRLFPEQEGYQLAARRGAGRPTSAAVTAAIEDRLDAISAPTRCRTADRLAEFHRVENTYLSTFQTLGGLGLLLGTVGLAAVLLRNVLERRRELALLGAVGYGRGRLFMIVIAESTLLLVCGSGGRHDLRARRDRAGRRRARRPPPDRRQRLAAALRRLRDRPRLLDRRDARRRRVAPAGRAES